MSEAFRAAVTADVPHLLELQHAFYSSEGYPWKRDSMERGMLRLIADPLLGRVFVAGGGETLDGYLVLAFGFSLEFGGRDAFVDELYVRPEARGRGLGTVALAVAERACVEAGIVALHLEVEDENDRARQLYLRHGYSVHSRHLMTRRL